MRNIVRRFPPLLLALWLPSGCSFHVDGAHGSAVAPDLAVNEVVPADLAPPLGPDLTAPPPDLAAHGHVTVTVAPTPTPVDLTAATALASSDWAHWGFAKVSDLDRKATGNAQISALTVVGNGAVLYQYMPFPTSFTWSDGANGNGGHPMAPGPGNAGAVYVNTGGVVLTVPAGLAARKVVVYVSYCNAQARMQIALGDSSAAAYDDSSNMSNDDVLHDLAYTVDYSAASEGQLLTITWTLAANDLGATLTPAVALEAVVLGAPAPPSTTPPPMK
jgi:hypothetical protein